MSEYCEMLFQDGPNASTLSCTTVALFDFFSWIGPQFLISGNILFRGETI